MDKMKYIPTPLQGLYEIETDVHSDTRGKFSRMFCELSFNSIRPGLHFTQINLSETTLKGTIRGMHFQIAPAAEAKLIRCIRGSVLDVAVDVRSSSPTFLQWHAIELSDNKHNAVFIPEGFAHGFQALGDDVQMLYLHTANWSAEHERGLRYDDPRLAIPWPLTAQNVSEKDSRHEFIQTGFSGVSL